MESKKLIIADIVLCDTYIELLRTISLLYTGHLQTSDLAVRVKAEQEQILN